MMMMTWEYCKSTHPLRLAGAFRPVLHAIEQSSECPYGLTMTFPSHFPLVPRRPLAPLAPVRLFFSGVGASREIENASCAVRYQSLPH